MMATIDITKLSAKVLDYTDAEVGAMDVKKRGVALVLEDGRT